MINLSPEMMDPYAFGLMQGTTQYDVPIGPGQALTQANPLAAPGAAMMSPNAIVPDYAPGMPVPAPSAPSAQPSPPGGRMAQVSAAFNPNPQGGLGGPRSLPELAMAAAGSLGPVLLAMGGRPEIARMFEARQQARDRARDASMNANTQGKEVAEYRLAVEQGFQGSFLDYLRQRSQANTARDPMSKQGQPRLVRSGDRYVWANPNDMTITDAGIEGPSSAAGATRAPTTRSVDGELYQYDPSTDQWRDTGIGAADESLAHPPGAIPLNRHRENRLMQDIGDIDDNFAALRGITRDYDPRFANPLLRRAIETGESLSRFQLDIGDSEAAEALARHTAAIGNFTNVVRNAMFGATLTDSEKEAARQYLPDPDDTPAQIRGKVEGFAALQREIKQRKVRELQQGYYMPEEDADLTWQHETVPQPSAPSPPAGEITRPAERLSTQELFELYPPSPGSP